MQGWLGVVASVLWLCACGATGTPEGGTGGGGGGDSGVDGGERPFVSDGPFTVTSRFVLPSGESPSVQARALAGASLAAVVDGGVWTWHLDGGALEIEASAPGFATRVLRVRGTVDLGVVTLVRGVGLAGDVVASRAGRSMLVAVSGRAPSPPGPGDVVYQPNLVADAGTWLFARDANGALQSSWVSDRRWRTVRVADDLHGGLLVSIPDDGAAPWFGWWDATARQVTQAGPVEASGAITGADFAGRSQVDFPPTAVHGPTHRFAFRSVPFVVGELSATGLRLLRAVPASQEIVTTEPQFSPDGRYVSVLALAPGGTPTLKVHDLDGTGARPVALPGCTSGPGSWLKEGAGLASLDGNVRQDCSGLSIAWLDGGISTVDPSAVAAWPMTEGRIAVRRVSGTTLAVLPLDGGAELSIASEPLTSTVVLRGGELLFSTASRSAVLSLERGAVTEVALSTAEVPYRAWNVACDWAATAAREVSSELPTATPFMDGQAWCFPGEADAWTSMRSSELAAYNNDVVLWTAPNAYVFRNQRLQSTSLNFQCAAQGQAPAVQDLCDRVDHNGTLDIPWAKFQFDSVIRDTGELVIAESPYPTTNDRHLLWVRMGLQANRNLEVLQSNYLVVATNNEYFTPDGVSATTDGTSMFGVLAGRVGVTGSGTMRDVAGFVATRYEPATNTASVLGTVDGFDAVEPRGAIDHASGRLAFIGRKATQATLPAPEGTTQYDQRDVETVVLFDPATRALRSLPPLSMRVMQTTDAPGALFSIDILRGWDPTKPKPGSAFWSDGRLYVVLVESVLQTNLRSVVREVVVITPA